MATGKGKSGNGQTVRILREIWNETKALNGRIDGLRGDIQRLDGRIENLLLGSHAAEHRDFRERIVRLEIHAGLPPQPPR